MAVYFCFFRFICTEFDGLTELRREALERVRVNPSKTPSTSLFVLSQKSNVFLDSFTALFAQAGGKGTKKEKDTRFKPAVTRGCCCTVFSLIFIYFSLTVHFFPFNFDARFVRSVVTLLVEMMSVLRVQMMVSECIGRLQIDCVLLRTVHDSYSWDTIAFVDSFVPCSHFFTLS